jgi:hypothetical protein
VLTTECCADIAADKIMTTVSVEDIFIASSH